MLIRDLPDDGVVRVPGAYRIPIDRYHSQEVCPGPSISSGGLRTIFHQSPAHFFATSEINPDRIEEPPNDDLTFGRAAHALLLGEEVFDDVFIMEDDDAPRRPTKAQILAKAEGRVSEAARRSFDYWRTFEILAEGRTLVRAEWMDNIRGMSRSLAAHPLVGPLFDGEAEVSLIWQDEQTGVWLKARPDMLPRMGDVKADLKTTTDVSLRHIHRQTEQLGYDMQAALGCIGMEKVQGLQVTSDVLVFIEKKAPWDVTALEIPAEALHWAKLKLRRALNTFADCLKTGVWPGKVQGIPQFTTPEWRVEEYARGQAAGDFPRDFDAPFGNIVGDSA